MSEISAALCTACRGALPLQLHGPITCPFCGSVDAIDPALQRLVLTARERLSKREKAWRQFLDQERVFDVEFYERVSRYFPLLCILWLFAGGIFLGVAGTGAGGASVTDLVTGAVPVRTQDEMLAWSTVYTGALFAVLTFGLPAIGLFFVRRAAISTRPVPPALPGAPPRCRCCLAELPRSGGTRRCAYCGADHLVLDEKWRRHQSSLDDQVRDALAQGHQSLQTRLKSVEKLVSAALGMVVFCLPLSLCVVGIVSAAITPSPGWFLVPAIGGALAVVVYLRLYRQVRRMREAELTESVPV